MTLLLMILQFISLIGLLLFTKKIMKIDIFYCPIFVICAIFIILLFFGYIGALFIASCIVYIFGFLSLVLYFRELKDKKTIMVIIMFALGSFLLYAFKIRYLNLSGWDDFVVWGSRVKAMLLDNNLPSYEDITFIPAISYGEATGLWIYYFCRFLKNYESLYLLAQQIVLISCIITIIPLIKKITPYKGIVFGVFVVYMLTVNNDFSNLYVDGLMAAVCVAGISVAVKDANNKEIVLLSILVFLSQIKKNGIYFVFVVIVFYFVYNKKISIKKRIFNILLFFVIPLIIIHISFNNYVQSIYLNAPSVNQTVSVYQEIRQGFFEKLIKSFIPSDKTPAQCLTIAESVVKNSLNITYKRPMGLLSVLISALLILMSSSFSNAKECIKAELVMFAIYFGYIICAIYAYLFVFGIRDALGLASFDRYLLVGVEVSVSVGVLYRLISNENNYVKYIISICLLLVLSNHNINTLSILPQFSYPTNLSEREKFKNMLKDVEPNENNTFLIIDIVWLENERKMNQNSFHYGSVIYDLWSADFGVVKNRSEIAEELEHWTEWCDYLLINTPTYETNVYLESIGKGDFDWQEYTIISASEVMNYINSNQDS